MAKSLLSELEYYINPNTPPFLQTVAVIILCPLIWNVLARSLRYYTSTIAPNTSTTTRYALCYAMTVWIFAFSSYRDILVHQNMSSQHPHPLLQQYAHITHILGIACVVIGQIFVLSSFWALGITGTFLGDYVGILMDAPVTHFPFSVLKDPMYDGATLCFLGTSLYYDSPAGLFFTAVIYIVYQIALRFEGSHLTQQNTDMEHTPDTSLLQTHASELICCVSSSFCVSLYLCVSPYTAMIYQQRQKNTKKSK